MPIHIISRHLELSQQERDYIDKKIKRLSKYFERIDDVSFTLIGEKREKVAEIDFHSGVFHEFSKAKAQTLQEAIDSAVDKLEQQIVKDKAKRQDKSKGLKAVEKAAAASEENLEDTADSEVVQ